MSQMPLWKAVPPSKPGWNFLCSDALPFTSAESVLDRSKINGLLMLIGAEVVFSYRQKRLFEGLTTMEYKATILSR